MSEDKGVTPNAYEEQLAEKFAHELDKFKHDDFVLDAVMKVVDQELGICGSEVSRQLRSRLVDSGIFQILGPIKRLVQAGKALTEYNRSCTCYWGGSEKVLMHEAKDSIDNGLGECSWCLEVKEWEAAISTLPKSMRETSEQ